MFLDHIIKNCSQSIYRYPHVLDYLHSRLVTDEEIKYHELGYNKIICVPEESSEDYKRFCIECYKGKKLENKILFPIKDILGNIIGVSGRSVETKEFKVFVTEEAKYTGFFFGLYHALPYIYKENKVYVVEGYFDFLALVKVFPNTVATLTAGISESQYNLLQLYCNKIVTVFDEDSTGHKGTEKAPLHTDKIKESWLPRDICPMRLGNYKDPAKCLETLGVNKFKEFIMKKNQDVAMF